ncbi:MAG: hypothetical protein PHS30_09425 [Bacteroidales bacterium]|nr:hypothetical protein [Bacteroidales bacterium]
MTNEQQKLLTNFETRVRQLMLLCDSLRLDNAALKNALEVQEIKLKEAKEGIHSLTIKYDNLKLAKMISYGDTDVKNAQQRLSKLVREVDKCIELINE